MTKESKQIAIKTMLLSIFTSVGLVLLKGLSGYFGHSFALIADAIESTADIFSSFVVYLGLKFAQRPADRNHPYGHGKVEPLMTFVIVAFLVGSAALIIYQSIINIQTRHTPSAAWTLLVLAVIIAWKETAFHLIMKRAKKTQSTTLRAEAWHQRSDAITSVAAFIGISISVVMGDAYAAADDWAALVASGLILYNAYGIFRPALGELMDEHLYDDKIEEIRYYAKEVPGVIDTEKCFIRKSGMVYFVDLHMIVRGDLSVYEGHDIAHRLKDHLLLKMPYIQDVLIHVEPCCASVAICRYAQLPTLEDKSKEKNPAIT